MCEVVTMMQRSCITSGVGNRERRNQNRNLLQWLRCTKDCKTAKHFTVVFYCLRNFGCTTTQVCVTRRQCYIAEPPSVGDRMQRSGSTCKKSSVNYKSAALPTELCRRSPYESRFTEFIK